jgi:hypothetical protein
MKRVWFGVAVLTIVAVCAAGCGPAGETGIKVEAPVVVTTQQAAPPTEPPVSTTSTTTSTIDAPEVSFVAPRGKGAGHVGYVEDAEGTWGPTSFCVLPDKSVAILDCGEECIQVFSHSGEPLRSIDLQGMTISPVDIQWWNDCFAILEFSSQPKSVLLVGLDGSLHRRIDLWDGMDETAQGLRIGRHGELELLTATASLNVLTDTRGEPLSPEDMLRTTFLPGFRGGPEIEVSLGPAGPLRGRLAGSTEWLPLAPDDALGGTLIASDDAGNTYLRTSRMLYDSSGNYVGGDTFVVKLDGGLRQVGFAPVDIVGLKIFTTRMVDVTSDGGVYSAVPKADGVHVETLHFAPAPPELTPTIASSDAPSIAISGPPVIERPRGTELFRVAWGSEPGQIGYSTTEQETPSQNPIELAVSPDGTTIAVLDYANVRVELFTRDGKLEQTILIPATTVLGGLAYDRQGALFLLPSDSVLALRVAGGAESGASSIAWGDWVYGPTAVDDSLTCQVFFHGVGSWVAVISSDAEASSLRNVPISSTELPLDSIRLLGRDYAGDFFLMARICGEGWNGTESWCFIGLSPHGDYLGKVRLPLDSWAGAGWAVTPGGTIIELRSTEAGIVAAEFELRR